KPETRLLTVEEYHTQAWGILQHLHDNDPAAWPASVPTDPDHPLWSFCFDGVPLFANFSNPGHKCRKSRNLGRSLALVVQPRQGFDLVAGNDPEGQKVRELIRSRIASYDSVPVARELATYGDPDACEWRQYGLPDDDGTIFNTCPLNFNTKE